MMVLDMGFEMRGEMVDSLGQKRDLHSGVSGVFVGLSVLLDKLRSILLEQTHSRPPSLIK
jgi:hypothetical protein